jgi:hypothetical protein
MASYSPDRKSAARDIFAGMVACLFFLQVLASLASVNRNAGTFGSGVAVDGRSTMGVLCADASVAEGRDHVLPDSNGREHGLCCSACALGSRDAALIAILPFIVSTLLFAPVLDAAPAARTPDDRPPTLLGWTSSWSSRAPPLRP